MRLPVVGNVSSKDGATNKNARLTNMLAEQKKNGTTLATVRPGLNGLATSSGDGNNLVCFGVELVNIYGNTVYKVTAQGGDALDDPNTGTTLREIGRNTISCAYLDQIVITKGAARYISSYSPECLTSGTDSLDANVVMRLRMEGADGSTTITDDKGHAITNSGSCHIKTDQYTCGAASLKMDGASLPTFSYSSDWNLDTGDFCLEARIRFYSFGAVDWESDINLIGVYDTSSPYGGYRFVLATDPDLEEIVGVGLIKHGVSQIIYEPISHLSLDTWYSFAVSRQGGVVRLFKDGQIIDEVDTASYSMTSIGTVTDNFFDFALIP